MDFLIIALFGIGSFLVHYLIYLYVKFKMDEGVVVHLYKDRARQFRLSIDQIAYRGELDVQRADYICRKSKKLEPVEDAPDTWRLAYAIKA